MMADANTQQALSSFVDRFDDDQKPGKVLGSLLTGGIRREGVDVENVISIDNGALRIAPLIEPGWNRAGIRYPDYPRRNGLIFAAFMLNGHNTSEANSLSDSFRDRLWRWANGSGDGWKNLAKRAFYWLKGGYRAPVWNKLRWWYHIRAESGFVPNMNENMALGWFPSGFAADPFTAGGHSFVMHAGGSQNGELWTHSGADFSSVIPSVQNIPIYYVVALREQGAVYYAASLPNVPDFTAFPSLRPIAIDPTGNDPNLSPAIYQSVLGQIGFRVDSRVYTTQVVDSSALANWYGTAHAADRLSGNGDLAGSLGDAGGNWQQVTGIFTRSSDGVRSDNEALAVLMPDTPTGLLNIMLQMQAGLIWRFQDVDNYWLASLVHEQFSLGVKTAGEWHQLCEMRVEIKGEVGALQVNDSGMIIQVYADGKLVWRGQDERLQDSCGVGIYSPSANGSILNFEAHPRQVTIPELQLEMPWRQTGTKEVITDDFVGGAGDLEGSQTTQGDKVWQRLMGAGFFDRTGENTVRIRASIERPNWERTAYTVDWDNPDFADLSVNIQPPGHVRDEGNRCRGGFIFWQDNLNFIIVNTWWDDYNDIASISSFFTIRGVEDIYDAVWTNVGNRLTWGTPLRLRVLFDGTHYMAHINDEPVLYRALTDVYPRCPRLRIHRVGLVANWEWGDDTGSYFSHFVAKV